MENFYEYINNKYVQTNRRIKKKQHKLKKIHQLGGTKTSIAKMQVDLAYLEALKSMMGKKVQTADTVNFSAISDPLKKLVDELGVFSNKINQTLDAKSDVNLQTLTNQMNVIDQFITSDKEAYLNVRVPMKTKIIVPPLDVPQIDSTYGILFENIDKDMSSVIETIKNKDGSDDANFNKKLEDLEGHVKSLSDKVKNIDEYVEALDSKINEINKYTDVTVYEEKDKYREEYEGKDITIDLKPELFKKSDDKPDTIKVSKLEDLIIDTKPDSEKVAESVGKYLEKLSQIEISPENIVEPNFNQIAIPTEPLSPRGKTGGASIDKTLSPRGEFEAERVYKTTYWYDENKVSKIMNHIYEKWVKKLEDTKKEIADKLAEIERRKEYLKTIQDSNKLIIRNKLEEVKSGKLIELQEKMKTLLDLYQIVKDLVRKNKLTINNNLISCEGSQDLRPILENFESNVSSIDYNFRNIGKVMEQINNTNESKELKDQEQFDKLSELISEQNSKISETIEQVTTYLNQNNNDFKTFPEKCVKYISNETKKMFENLVNNLLEILFESVDFEKNDVNIKEIRESVLFRLYYAYKILDLDIEKDFVYTKEKLILMKKCQKTKGPQIDKACDSFGEFKNKIRLLDIGSKIKMLDKIDDFFKLEEQTKLNAILTRISASTSPNVRKLNLDWIFDNVFNHLDNVKLKKIKKLLYGSSAGSIEIKKEEFVNNIISKFNEVADLSKTITKLGVQIGGFIPSWEKYYYKIIDLSVQILNYKRKYNLFKKKAKEFNLLYIQLYRHQLYVTSYIQLVLLQKDYLLYETTTRGTMTYYLGIVRDLVQKCENPEIRESNLVIQYFYNNHYITLKILFSFLQSLTVKWQPRQGFKFLLPKKLSEQELESIKKKNQYSDKDLEKIKKLNKLTEEELKNEEEMETEKEINESKLILIPQSGKEDLLTDKMRKGLFIFNLFKDILDSYKSSLGSPVAVYLRINDWSKKVGIDKDKPAVFVKDKINTTIFDVSALKRCDPKNEEVKKATPASQLEKLDLYKNLLGKIKFNEIFDPKGFTDNKTLANYMSLPTYLSKNKSIMMITYGYSGVGKTFTLFGKDEDKINNMSGSQGLLQVALQGIQNEKGIYMRVFEIYGKGLPYKSYWMRKPDEYDHEIISYILNDINEIPENMVTPNNINKPDAMREYLQKIEAQSDSGYNKVERDVISSFHKFVDAIDNIRIKNGRIKKTVNNDVSSRSIMVYEFKIKIEVDKQEKYVRFVVMDLPGKEDIKSTYVDNIKSNEPEYCIKLKEEILKLGYDENALRAAIFLNPIFISIFPDIATKLCDYFIDKNYDSSKIKISSYIPKDETTKEDATYKELTTLSDIFDYIGEKRTKEPIKSTINRYGKNISEDEIKNKDFKKTFNVCLAAAEIMKYFIENNKLNDIAEFYNKELIENFNPYSGKDKFNNLTCQSVNSGALPLEGFYINENILGLVNVLRERLLGKKAQADPSSIMENFFSNKMGKREAINTTDHEIKIIENNEEKIIQPGEKFNMFGSETIAQTYFLRNLLRERLSDNKYLISDSDEFLLKKVEGQKSPYEYINYSTSGNNLTLQKWIEEAYDFNKSFSTKEPPIKTFLKSYFKIDEENTSVNKKYVIDNFYLFYVVSNEFVKKCANQIKLIADSKNFIDIINAYAPPTDENLDEDNNIPIDLPNYDTEITSEDFKQPIPSSEQPSRSQSVLSQKPNIPIIKLPKK